MFKDKFWKIDIVWEWEREVRIKAQLPGTNGLHLSWPALSTLGNNHGSTDTEHNYLITHYCFAGHMIIPYYIQQKEAKEKKEMERLRIRCQSYESGYYSDPKCENLYQNTYNGFNSGVRIDLRPGLTILAPLMLSLALLVVWKDWRVIQKIDFCAKI